MSIAKSCMLVNLRVGMWTGRRLDKQISAEVTSDKQAQEDALKVNKQIVPKEVLAPIVTAANNLRSHFYDKTLPWAQQGARVITRTGYQAFVQRHGELEAAFREEARKLVQVGYPQARAKAEFRMGLAFDPADYPEPYELESKFYVELDIDPVPQSNDFRVDVSTEAANAIRKDIEDRVRSRVNEAAKHVWERLHGVVDHYAKTMADQDIRFKEATVRNLHELVEAMPALNILEDPALDQFAKEVRQSLNWSAKEIREKPETRAAAAAEAQAILDRMSGMINAFSGMQAAA